ncbi:MAG: prepilin-type N-terminal cleavage/methylation domain-containing protein [Bacilli bacterium]|nr:prepilin-type N-terminal cleavage/methylation domain-containing protein [Bacilli bacterium]
MKNKGFTLVELIAVLVLMGMLVLVVFPATSRLLRGNEEKKYQTYYDIVGEAVKKYARTRRDDIGGIDGHGCVDDKTISDLVSLGYIKEFDQEEGVKCKSPSEWSSVELIQAGIDPSPEDKYINMRIENINGKITTSYSMICLKGKNVKYQMLLNETSECKKNVPDVSSSLYSKIQKMKNDNIITVVQDKEDYYLDKMNDNGLKTINNNYVLYSGKLWRILSYNENNKTIKLVSDDIIALRKYENKEYNNSDLYRWLNVKDTTSTTGNFISSLKNPDKFIVDYSWNFTAVNNDTEPANTNKIEAKVGMLNYHEYSKAGDFIKNGKDFWLISTSGETNKAWYVDSTGTPTKDDVDNYHGVRPTIVLKANITITNSGSGEKTNPFRITGDASASVGTIISTRFPGEYVKLNNLTYRIVSTDGGYIKLIGTKLLSTEEKKFDSKKSYSTTDSLIFTKETSTYEDLANEIGSSIKNYIGETTFCIYDDTTSKEECNALFSLALPRVGEMFTSNSSKKYWTLSNETKDKIYIVNEDGSLTSGGSEDKASILPIIVLKGNYAIVSGNGTITSPYTIE